MKTTNTYKLMLAGMTAAVLFVASANARAAESMPTLDDLLNLTGPSTDDNDADSGDSSETSDADADLNNDMLDEMAQPGADQFQVALDLMQQSARRIGNDRDPGVETQRMQEEVIAKLDQMIANQSKKRPKSSQSSSSSGGSQDQQQDQGSEQNAAKQQNQQAGEQDGEQGTQQRSGTGENDGQASPGEAQQAQADDSQFIENREQWGNLPPRVRDELMQGMSEKISSVYKQDTQEYYERLAKEQQE